MGSRGKYQPASAQPKLAEKFQGYQDTILFLALSIAAAIKLIVGRSKIGQQKKTNITDVAETTKVHDPTLYDPHRIRQHITISSSMVT